MPPANNIGFSATSDMVTSTIGVQTSCPTSPSHQHFYDDDIDDICPKHFTDIHKCKLEDTFSRKQKPDDIQLQIIAMECNLLYKDVRDWFRKRRLKWMEELVRSENTVSSRTSSTKDTRSSRSTNNLSREYNKQSFSTNVAPSSDSNNNSMLVSNTNKQTQQNTNHKHHQQQLQPSSIDNNSSYKNKNLLKNNSNNNTGGVVARNHHDISTT